MLPGAGVQIVPSRGPWRTPRPSSALPIPLTQRGAPALSPHRPFPLALAGAAASACIASGPSTMRPSDGVEQDGRIPLGNSPPTQGMGWPQGTGTRRWRGPALRRTDCPAVSPAPRACPSSDAMRHAAAQAAGSNATHGGTTGSRARRPALAAARWRPRVNLGRPHRGHGDPGGGRRSKRQDRSRECGTCGMRRTGPAIKSALRGGRWQLMAREGIRLRGWGPGPRPAGFHPRPCRRPR